MMARRPCVLPTRGNAPPTLVGEGTPTRTCPIDRARGRRLSRLAPLMPQNGFALGPKLSDAQKADVEFGFRIAKEVSRLEIGQTVVVKDGTVLAVEGFEGTDKCLARGGELAGKNGGAVAVKVAKLNHDMRFDIPCIGSQTLEICATVKISVLALESGKSLLLEREACEELATKNKISVTTIS